MSFRISNTLWYELSQTVLGLSSVYQHGKTQVPRRVRKALAIKDGDQILWLFENGKITVRRNPRVLEKKLGKYAITEKPF